MRRLRRASSRAKGLQTALGRASHPKDARFPPKCHRRCRGCAIQGRYTGTSLIVVLRTRTSRIVRRPHDHISGLDIV